MVGSGAKTFGRERDDDKAGLDISLNIHPLETHATPSSDTGAPPASSARTPSTESIHAFVNTIHRRCACVRGLIVRDKAKHSALEVAQNTGANEAKRQHT
jgi:hypothetical protein